MQETHLKYIKTRPSPILQAWRSKPPAPNLSCLALGKPPITSFPSLRQLSKIKNPLIKIITIVNHHLYHRVYDHSIERRVFPKWRCSEPHKKHSWPYVPTNRNIEFFTWKCKMCPWTEYKSSSWNCWNLTLKLIETWIRKCLTRTGDSRDFERYGRNLTQRQTNVVMMKMRKRKALGCFSSLWSNWEKGAQAKRADYWPHMHRLLLVWLPQKEF